MCMPDTAFHHALLGWAEGQEAEAALRSNNTITTDLISPLEQSEPTF